MTQLSLFAAAVTTPAAPAHLNPLQLFLDADIVVKVVMIGLILASVWVWTIIASFTMRYGKISKACDSYERDFWKAADIDAFQAERGKGDVPTARIAAAAIGEWRRSTGGKSLDREGTRQRLAQAMDGAIAQEADNLSERLNFLATVGSVAPFVGLFGTVWGIMKAFQAIAVEKSTNLAVVAPSIAEALFATAIGLIAAIPAYIAYNKFSTDAGKYAGRLEGFADDLSTAIQRRLAERV